MPYLLDCTAAILRLLSFLLRELSWPSPARNPAAKAMPMNIITMANEKSFVQPRIAASQFLENASNRTPINDDESSRSYIMELPEKSHLIIFEVVFLDILRRFSRMKNSSLPPFGKSSRRIVIMGLLRRALATFHTSCAFREESPMLRKSSWQPLCLRCLVTSIEETMLRRPASSFRLRCIRRYLEQHRAT